jgi:ABC-type phosphate/phosphonate transport system substrate-binding protein
VSKDAQMKQPADMKGKRFGMPDPDSITAVITRATMRDLGIDSAKAEIRTTRYQDAVPFFVENGFSDVGVSASGAVIKQWQEKGGAVLFESKAVPIKHMIASTKMSDTDLEKVRALMLGLDKSDAGQKILAKIGYKATRAATRSSSPCSPSGSATEPGSNGTRNGGFGRRFHFESGDLTARRKSVTLQCPLN